MQKRKISGEVPSNPTTDLLTEASASDSYSNRGMGHTSRSPFEMIWYISKALCPNADAPASSHGEVEVQSMLVALASLVLAISSKRTNGIKILKNVLVHYLVEK